MSDPTVTRDAAGLHVLNVESLTRLQAKRLAADLLDAVESDFWIEPDYQANSTITYERTWG
jgi:hypothetical protein